MTDRDTNGRFLPGYRRAVKHCQCPTTQGRGPMEARGPYLNCGPWFVCKDCWRWVRPLTQREAGDIGMAF